MTGVVKEQNERVIGEEEEEEGKCPWQLMLMSGAALVSESAEKLNRLEYL